MTQTGIVTKLLDKGFAEVAVERITACGHCAGCGECIYGKKITVEAQNKIYAKPGERVVLESETKTIMKITLLIYMLPVAMLFAGYAVGAALGLGQEPCIVASIIGMGVGALTATYLGRRFKKVDYSITSYYKN